MVDTASLGEAPVIEIMSEDVNSIRRKSQIRDELNELENFDSSYTPIKQPDNNAEYRS